VVVPVDLPPPPPRPVPVQPTVADLRARDRAVSERLIKAEMARYERFRARLAAEEARLETTKRPPPRS
jgi:hypothetical protein